MKSTPAPEWQYRDADGRIIRFPDIKSQPEIDAKTRVGVKPFVAMFCAAITVAAIMAAFDWMVSL